jgi:acyl-CoA synthetase (AMP-forming)/AMP-acid ligase II/thioesterase domain-containing protein
MSHTESMSQHHSDSENLCIQLLLQAQAERNHDGIAITAPGRRGLSYSRLLRQINEIVPQLNSMGMGRQDCVALVLPNGPEMAVAFLAVAAGATCAPLNPSYSASEFDSHLSGLKAKALIVQSGIDSPVIGVALDCGIPVIELTPLSDAPAGLFTLWGRQRPRPLLQGFSHCDDVALALHTSGTTSQPKVVPLTQANICYSARSVAGTLLLNPEDRCLNVMPLFHIHGLVGALLSSLAAGASVVCSPGLYSPRFFDWINDFSPTWYTASPTIHQAILSRAAANRETIARNPLRFIRSSSAPLSRPIRTELETVFKAPIIESYGMTEAAHQIASNPLPPGHRKNGSVGLAAGPETAIMDETGNLLENGKSGEIVIRGTNVMLGYMHNQPANTRAFTNGWFRTGDEGFLDEEGYLFITGRLKEMINSGGEKIAPCEVDEVLMTHPAVAQAVTFALPHNFLGEKVAAAIVLRKNSTSTVREIQTFVAERLIHLKVPHPVLIVDEIPKGPTGKLQRIGLAEKLGLTSARQSEHEVKSAYVAPLTPLEKQLADIWAKTFGLEQVGAHDNFFDLGGYSLLATHMLNAIEKLTGKQLSPGILFQAPTVAQLVRILDNHIFPSSWSSLVPMQPKGSKPPFFCVHPIGGSILWYYDLARHLGPDQPFYGLQALGLDGKMPLHTSIETMAAHYVKELMTVQPHGPYYLGGYSFGGLVAFEMAQQLRCRGQEVALLALLDTRGPGYPRLVTRTIVASTVGVTLVDKYSRHFHALSSLEREEKLEYLRTRIVNKAEIINQEFKRKIERLTRSVRFNLGMSVPYSHDLEELKNFHRQLAKDYVPQIYPGLVTLFRARKQPNGIFPDTTLGWARLAASGLEIHEVPGDHTTVIREPLVDVLAAGLVACLQRDRFAA